MADNIHTILGILPGGLGSESVSPKLKAFLSPRSSQRTTPPVAGSSSRKGELKRLNLLTHFIFCNIAVMAILASPSLGQEWELGTNGGYGWYIYPTIYNSGQSAEAGVPSKGALGVTVTENITNHFGGEIRYLLRFGGPQLTSDGTQANLGGHTNTITYDFLFYTSARESTIRPFVAGGAGIKVYTGTGQRFADINQPLVNFALLRPITQVEPAISAGGGIKFLLPKHVQLRVELRAYMTPLPDEVFRLSRQSMIHGWLYDFVPLAGISYAF